MPDKIYFAVGETYVTLAEREAMPGRYDSVRYSPRNLVVAPDREKAKEKFLADLNNVSSFGRWKIFFIDEPTAGKDIPLETRIEILREVLPVLE
mgnify:CR=1 FL=1